MNEALRQALGAEGPLILEALARRGLGRKSRDLQVLQTIFALTYKFQDKSKFALLTFNSVYVELRPEAFHLSDGTWAMPSVPVADLDIWKEWIGSIRIEQLQRANLVLLVEEASNNPEILDDVHKRLSDRLAQLFDLMHLQVGMECGSADMLYGSSIRGVPVLRQLSPLPTFYQSKGYRRSPITERWLEEAVTLRTGLTAIRSNAAEFQRTLRGLNILANGLQQQAGQDRLHQFVRSLEALILPDVANTRKQFAHRCQTFAGASDATRNLLLEAFAMRSDAEHVHPWDRTVQRYPADQRDDLCWQRTRQMERLACGAYARLLRDDRLRIHFRTDDVTAAFWKMPDDRRCAVWADQLDITREPLVREYDQWGRATT